MLWEEVVSASKGLKRDSTKVPIALDANRSKVIDGKNANLCKRRLESEGHWFESQCQQKV